MTMGKQSVLSKQLSESEVRRVKDHHKPPPHLTLIIVADIISSSRLYSIP